MKYFLFFIFITLNSCNYYNNNIIIKNSSEKMVDSVLIFGNPKCEPLKISNIKPLTTKSDNLLNCNKTSNDGSYTIQIYSNNSMQQKQYGYFTNGTAIFNEIIIEINMTNDIIISGN